MKVCTIMESEIYLNGIDRYIRSTYKFRNGIKSILLEEFNNPKAEIRLIANLKEYDLLILDFNSYERIVDYYCKHRNQKVEFKGKIIFVKFNSNVPIFSLQDQDRSWKFRTSILSIDHIIQASISQLNFRRLIFQIMSESIDKSRYNRVFPLNKR